jgi:hypothetical protein
MAQPTTTLIATPDPEPNSATCHEGLRWCDGTCNEWDDQAHHTTGFEYMEIDRGNRGSTMLAMSVFRTDTDDRPGPVQIFMGLDSVSDEMTLSPKRARQFAAMLLNAADDADPLEPGVVILGVEHVRLHDRILTRDGWQTVVGQMAFDDQVNVWTDDHDHDPESDGWLFEPGDPVSVRRQLADTDTFMWRESGR